MHQRLDPDAFVAPQRRISTPVWIDLAFLTVVIGVLFFTFLGSRPLFVPDEGRYAEIAREMASSNDFITPTLNGIIYFEKPVLFYWAGALAFKLLGVSIWIIRSINAIFALLGCLLTYGVTRTLYGRTTALWAALIQATSLLYFIMAHMVSLDLPVTFFLSACLYSFVLATQAKQANLRRIYFYGAAASAALAVLTKGLIGMVFPILIIGSWLFTNRRQISLRHWPLLSSLLIFLLITTPWHILVQLKHHEFFYFYIVEQHFLRYTDLSVGHYEPVWFFVPYLIAGFLPWILFLPQSIKMVILKWRAASNDRYLMFFLQWALIVFAFFSFSKSKLIPYILPMFPPLAIITARYLTQHQRLTKLSLVLVSVFSIIFISIMGIFPKYDTRSIKPLADQLTPIIKPTDEVITYNQYFQDLPFYLRRQVSIVNWQNELKFGMGLQNTREHMINTAIFLQRFKGHSRVFVILSLSEFNQFSKDYPNLKPILIASTQTNVLISNQPR